MGLLTIGKALSPEETFALSAYIREHGITQFLCTWARVKDIHDDELRYGDEIECGIFVVDPVHKTIKIVLKSAEKRDGLIAREASVAHQSEGCTWHPEFGAWMIESTPSKPYGNLASDLLRVERNMILRRTRLLSSLAENEIAPTVTNFPLLGVGEFIHNQDALPFTAEHSQSQYLPDYIINPHPRFAALTESIRTRRGKLGKVCIRVPLFKDTATPEFLRAEAQGAQAGAEAVVSPDTAAPVLSNGQALEADTYIHMDAMAFGMGMCCLQVTFQATNVDESRYIYDQLAVLAPIMLALTAASPIFKGRLADVDARWNIIAQSVDDRTEAERREAGSGQAVAEDEIKPTWSGQGVRPLHKSRYDSISTYIYHCKGDSACKRTFEHYNDIPCPVDEEVKARLLGAGIDENLAHHLAHIFTRDPLVIFEGNIEMDDETHTDHFENIQSTNWQTCRWKPPPPREHPDAPHIGWRTEFRSMEVQLTDFENAAFTCFIVLVTRVILAFDLALYIPLSKVDANMQRAQLRDATAEQKFYFRKYLAPLDFDESATPPSSSNASSSSSSSSTSSSSSSSSVGGGGGCGVGVGGGGGASCDIGDESEDAFEEMTMNEIFNGKESFYPGLLPLVYAYLDYIQCDATTFARVDQYLNFIAARARGELITPAKWMRNFVTSHPAYAHDSVVSSEIAHDLMMACKSIGEGSLACPELLGPIEVERIRPDNAYGTVLKGRLSSGERSILIQKLVARGGRQIPSDVPRGKSRGRAASHSSSPRNAELEGGN